MYKRQVEYTHAEEHFVAGLYLIKEEALGVRERPNIDARIQKDSISFHTNIWISDVASDPPDAPPCRIWGRLKGGGGWVVLLDRNSLWLACEPLGEDATLRAERAQAAVRNASAAKAAQATAVGAVAASPPANAPAASPIVETGVVPVAQEQRESSIVRCCHGHGMQTVSYTHLTLPTKA